MGGDEVIGGALDATANASRLRRARMTAAVVLVLALASCASEADDFSFPSSDEPTGDEPTGGEPSTSPDDPVVDPTLATAIPAITGVRYAEADVPTYYEALRLPSGARFVRRAIEVDGRVAGYVMVVGPPNQVDDETFEDTVVDDFFASPVDVVRDETEADGGTFMVTNSVDPLWTAVGDEFVMEAAQTDVSPAARRQWFWDGLLWIVEGTSDTRPFTEQLIAAQHEIAPPDDYDTHVIAGELVERFADLPDYTYIDLLRNDLLANLSESIAGSCADQWLAFGVSSDPNDVVIGEDNIFLQMAVIGARCDSFPDDFRATFMEYPGAHDETISGIPAIVGDTTVAWLEDGIVFVVNSEDPATIGNYRPFLDAFIQTQADLPTVG